MPARLKSLELQGYKTFASHTDFVFAERVTAIVGPNGSGKSNIADALRWVLGEQSFSLLRGKKTEDMIFSGSEQRPRAGMASATIIFDNSDGWLPIDFTEVAITRRAYRDGENEYLLNGQRVRLRDVGELLARSGLAERTYTIIGQGLVDAALALKAEERRRLFEEAAGIGLYRSRREEALKRLETTKRNLERVEDILAELQPRLRSLERQARRMVEYEQVQADLRVLLRDWYGFHWHAAQRELTEAREAARQQETGLAEARQAQAGLGEQMTGLRDRTRGLRARLDAWRRQLAQLQLKREDITRDLAVGDERARSLTDQRQAALDALARLDEELGLYQERQASAAQAVAGLQGELEEARTEVNKARQALRARQTEREAADKRLQALRQNLSGLTNRQVQLQARLAERQAQSKRNDDALQAAAQALAKAEQDLQTVEGRWHKTLQARQTAETARQTAEETLQAQRQKLDEGEALRKQKLEARAARAAELARWQAQLDVLEQAEAALAGYADGARVLLQAARQARLPGVRGALSSALEAPAELETALTAVLGEFLEAVILAPGGSADEALGVLAAEAVRGVLLPLDALAPTAPLTVSTGAGVLGVAANLVQAPPELRPAVDLLLGQVLVVQDRAAARRALAGQAAGVRAVTLRGEVFYANGPILAGQEGKVTPLSRPRQRKELQASLATTQQKLAELDEQVHKLEAALARLRTDDETFKQELARTRGAEKEAQTAYNQAELAADQARRQAGWQKEQRSRLEAETSRLSGEIAQTNGELARLEGELGTAREQVRQQNAALAELALDEFQAQAAHWTTQAAVAERAVGDAQNRQREAQAVLERAQRSQAGQQARLAEVKAAAEALEGEKAGLRQAETAVLDELKALQVLIEPAEGELQVAEAEQAQLEAAEAEARQAFSQAEHRHAQARINLARRQEALETLRQRIEDDFGLVAFEYAESVSGPTPLPLGAMVEQLPHVAEVAPELEENIKRQRAQLRRMGPINPEAQAEYREVKERYEFLTAQIADLQKAEVDIKEVIAELDLLMEREFRKTFEAVAHEFRQIFTRLFGGGSARLMLTDPDDLTNTGIDIEARLPGRREQGLSLLSGGERSLTATSLVFALLKFSPTPFCVMDEVDAMLDEANVGRFRDLLSELSEKTQFIVVTHNRNTVQAADVIYGVTMGPDSASQVLSLKLDEVSKIVA